MRIWIINHYAIPPSSAGGTRHFNLALQLQKQGHEVLLIAANYNHFSQSFMTTKTGELDKSFPVPFVWLPVPAYKGNTVKRFWNMLVFMRSLLRNAYLRRAAKPDVIIGSSPHLFAALGAERLAKRLNCPFVMEIRDLWPESLVDLGRFTHKHPLIIVMKLIEKYLYKRAAKIISLLPSVNDYLTQHSVGRENILWLPNAVDISSLPTFVKNTNNKFTVMYAGAHGVANDLETLVSAAQILQNKGLENKIEIVLIGDGPQKLHLQNLAEDISLVTFKDALPKNKIYETLNQADAFIMLLKKSPVFRWGISPNKLFDYFALAKPVIFGVETPFNPVAKYNAGISITPSNPQELADALERLALLSEDERTAMGARGKEYVLEHHDVNKLANNLQAFLQTTIDETTQSLPLSSPHRR